MEPRESLHLFFSLPPSSLSTSFFLSSPLSSLAFFLFSVDRFLPLSLFDSHFPLSVLSVPFSFSLCFSSSLFFSWHHWSWTQVLNKRSQQNMGFQVQAVLSGPSHEVLTCPKLWLVNFKRSCFLPLSSCLLVCYQDYAKKNYWTV